MFWPLTWPPSGAINKNTAAVTKCEKHSAIKNKNKNKALI
jgi:hypothetical protein